MTNSMIDWDKAKPGATVTFRDGTTDYIEEYCHKPNFNYPNILILKKRSHMTFTCGGRNNLGYEFSTDIIKIEEATMELIPGNYYKHPDFGKVFFIGYDTAGAAVTEGVENSILQFSAKWLKPWQEPKLSAEEIADKISREYNQNPLTPTGIKALIELIKQYGGQ